MKRYLTLLALVIAALVLTGCVNSTSGFSLSGIVATGAPAEVATVTLKDVNDAVLTATTDSKGSYTVTSGSAPATPVFIRATLSDGSQLHSLLEALPGSGEVANVSPATEAVVAQVVGDDPAAVFDKAKASRPSISASDVATAKAKPTAPSTIGTVDVLKSPGSMRRYGRYIPRCIGVKIGGRRFGIYRKIEVFGGSLFENGNYLRCGKIGVGRNDQTCNTGHQRRST